MHRLDERIDLISRDSNQFWLVRELNKTDLNKNICNAVVSLFSIRCLVEKVQITTSSFTV